MADSRKERFQVLERGKQLKGSEKIPIIHMHLLSSDHVPGNVADAGLSHLQQPCPFAHRASHLVGTLDLEQGLENTVPVLQCCLGLGLGVACRIISVGC